MSLNTLCLNSIYLATNIVIAASTPRSLGIVYALYYKQRRAKNTWTDKEDNIRFQNNTSAGSCKCKLALKFMHCVEWKCTLFVCVTAYAKCLTLSQSDPIEPVAAHSTFFSDSPSFREAGVNKVTSGQDHDPWLINRLGWLRRKRGK